jgi:hypothetical protein
MAALPFLLQYAQYIEVGGARIITRSRGFTSPPYYKETFPAFMKLAHISLREINFTVGITKLGIEMPVALSNTI